MSQDPTFRDKNKLALAVSDAIEQSLLDKNIGVNTSHNWGDQTAVEAGEGLQYFENAGIAYSDGNKFDQLKPQRNTKLEIIIVGDSTGTGLRVREDEVENDTSVTPSPVDCNPVVLTYPATGHSTTYFTPLRTFGFQSHYRAAQIVYNCGHGGEDIADMLARNSGSTGKATKDILGYSADAILVRAGINNLSSILTTNTTEQNEQAYADGVTDAKLFINQLIKSGKPVFWCALLGYSFTAVSAESVALRRPYMLRFNVDMKDYISTLRKDYIRYIDYYNSTGELTFDDAADGLHPTATKGLSMGEQEAATMTDMFGQSRNRAYLGTNILDTICSNLMLTNTAGLADTSYITSNANNLSSLVKQITRRDDGLDWQEISGVTNGTGLNVIDHKIIISAATLDCLATDTFGGECDVIVEFDETLLTEATTLSIRVETFMELNKTGAGMVMVAASAESVRTSGEKFGMVIPKFVIGEATAALGTCRWYTKITMSGTGVPAGKSVKLFTANWNLVKNPT